MQQLTILDYTGHTPKPITDETRAETKALFEKLLGQGHTAYRMDVPGKGTQIKSFEEIGTAEETILRPQLIGG